MAQAAGIRKLRTVGASVLYGMLGQLGSLACSAAVIYFFSKELWGEYSKQLVFAGAFLAVCGWGNREYLTTIHNLGFRQALAGNLLARLPLLAISLVVLLLAPGGNLPAACLLVTRFFISSLEILAVKEKKFSALIIPELVINTLFLLVLVFYKNLALGGGFVIPALLAMDGVRTVFYFVLLKPPLITVTNAPVLKELKASFPFFVNSITGFVASRADSLTMVFFLSLAQISAYQVSFNLVIIFQVLSNLIFYTYTFQFARLPVEAKRRVIRRFTLLGLLISGCFLATMPFLLKLVYGIDHPPAIYVILALFVLFGFAQQPYIYVMYNHKRSILISYIGLCSAAFFFCVLLPLNYFLPAALFNNFVFAAFASQCFRSAAFYLSGKKLLSREERAITSL